MVRKSLKKVISVVGARPNFMKVAPIDKAFKNYPEVKHIIVHTGQHYDYNMSGSFFKDLEISNPDYFLEVGSASHAVQTAKIMIEFEKVLLKEKPQMVIVVGDVNSTVACGLTSVKLGVKLAHIEAGLRSFDREMPEEINRLATDAISDYCFLTEQSAVDNLTNENFNKDKMFFVGNTMIDSLEHFISKTSESEHNKYQNKSYGLVTIHRPSNVDTKEQLSQIVEALVEIARKIKLVLPLHPRTKSSLEKFDLLKNFHIENIDLLGPQGYIDFLTLMKRSKFVLTDSGGIQEETTKLLVPCLTIRTSTERPSTIDLGTNYLIQPNKQNIVDSVNLILNNNFKKGSVPPLWDGKAAERITRIISDLI